MIFGKFDNAKDVWNMLAQRYNITQLAQCFQITKLIHMCQEPGQLVIDEFYSYTTYHSNKLSFLSHNGPIQPMHPGTLLFALA
jgi:hypothetical protein